MYLHEEFVHNTKAAFVILPLVMEKFQIATMIDIGCGIGTWLSVAKKLGVSEVKGVDANYVDRNLLRKHLLGNEFITHDLNQPLDLGKKFDFCLCLEVAEHLPENSADILVDTLIRHSDVILFSAAIPGQGGQNHINEQWPDYWQTLFLKKGFYFKDLIRPLIWENENVEFWYKQNIYIIVKGQDKYLDQAEKLFSRIVHPDLLVVKNDRIRDLEYKIKSILNTDESLRFYFNLFKKKIIKVLKNT